MKSSDVKWSEPRCSTRLWQSASSLALLLTVLVLLSSGCASSSMMGKLAPGVKPAAIQPLPQAGRQPKRTEKFSDSASRDIENWGKKLTGQETQDSPAKAPTTRSEGFPRPPNDPNL